MCAIESLHMQWISYLTSSCGPAFMWYGCYGLCQGHKATELAHSFLFCSCVYFCFYGPFNCISFHKFSQQLSVFSLCSSGLISALLVLSTIYLFMKVSFSPDIILCHQLTNSYLTLCCYRPLSWPTGDPPLNGQSTCALLMGCNSSSLGLETVIAVAAPW